MAKVKYNLKGTDVTFLANCNVYHKGLLELELYKIRSDRVPSLEQLKEGIEMYRRSFEGGKNGDRIQIALRKEARQRVTEQFEKVAQFLSSVAQEEDIPFLRQAGLIVVDNRKRSTKRAHVVQKMLDTTSMQETGVVVANPIG